MNNIWSVECWPYVVVIPLYTTPSVEPTAKMEGTDQSAGSWRACTQGTHSSVIDGREGGRVKMAIGSDLQSSLQMLMFSKKKIRVTYRECPLIEALIVKTRWPSKIPEQPHSMTFQGLLKAPRPMLSFWHKCCEWQLPLLLLACEWLAGTQNSPKSPSPAIQQAKGQNKHLM